MYCTNTLITGDLKSVCSSHTLSRRCVSHRQLVASVRNALCHFHNVERTTFRTMRDLNDLGISTLFLRLLSFILAFGRPIKWFIGWQSVHCGEKSNTYCSLLQLSQEGKIVWVLWLRFKTPFGVLLYCFHWNRPLWKHICCLSCSFPFSPFLTDPLCFFSPLPQSDPVHVSKSIATL